MKRDFLLMAYLGTVAVSVGLLLTDSREPVSLRFTEPQFPAGTGSQTSRAPSLQFILANGGPPAVHAGTITQLHDGRLLAAWFAGTREGASDVEIVMSSLAPGDSDWSIPTSIATREQTAEELNRYIAKLGNPILFADSRGRVWLFYVTVSMGGQLKAEPVRGSGAPALSLKLDFWYGEISGAYMRNGVRRLLYGAAVPSQTDAFQTGRGWTEKGAVPSVQRGEWMLQANP